MSSADKEGAALREKNKGNEVSFERVFMSVRNIAIFFVFIGVSIR